MKDDFLPIPDAPNFEINSELICRNTKTGHILKPFAPKPTKNFTYVLTMRTNHVDKKIMRTAKNLRAQAVAAVTDSTFEPIPSLNGRYEINARGIVRNSKTKQIIKPDKYGFVRPYVKEQKKAVRFNNYLWEVHGSYRKPKRQNAIKCSAENDLGKHFFDSLADCAKFLAPKVFYTVKTIRFNYLTRRKPEINGWKITYYEDDPSADNWNRQALGFEALRESKSDVIYIPTEAGIPITESARFFKKGIEHEQSQP